MSEELAQFLFEWLIWAGDTENSPFIFQEGWSLCVATPDNELEEELAAHLSDSGLGSLWAFDADRKAFFGDQQKHLNPLRIMWARQMLYKHWPELAAKVFFRDWLKWAVTGAEHWNRAYGSVQLKEKTVLVDYKPYAFSRAHGLCVNALMWLDYVDTDQEEEEIDEFLSCVYFRREDYPFNDKGYYYDKEANEQEMHLNPKRLAFCKEQVLKIYTPEWIK